MHRTLAVLLLSRASAYVVVKRAAAPRKARVARTELAITPDNSDLTLELKVGQIVHTTVLEEHFGGGYSVDIGTFGEPRLARLPKSEVALLPNVTSQLRSGAGKGWRALTPGSIFEGQVIAISGDGLINVSLARAQRGLAWRRVNQLATEDVTYLATVLRIGVSGAIVSVEELAAFLPWSHWSLAKHKRTNELEGTMLPVKFLEVDRRRDRLIVSHRRVCLDEWFAKLEPGQVVEGDVTALKEYGAKVALADGLDGLLHISQLSQVYVKNISDVISVGDSIKCVVIKLDAKDGSISLSTSMLETKPGDIVRDAKEVFARAALGQPDGRLQFKGE